MPNLFDLPTLVFANILGILVPILNIPLLPHYWFNQLFSILYLNEKTFQTTPEIHQQKLQKIKDQIRKWNQEGRKRKLCSARRNESWLRKIDKSNLTGINLGEMEDIIEIDLNNMQIKLEPGMKMGTLTQKLLPLGVMIPVIPEFETLTVGGLINGAGLETSSHRYGLFASTCLEYEVVLADGTIVNCAKDQHSDLFYSIPMSHGTLGFMTCVTFPLIKAGKYVKLEYNAARSLKEAETLLRRTETLFVEGIAFSKEKSVIMSGDYTDCPENGKINHINRWYKNWFFKHVEGFLNNTDPIIEYIPTGDYYHRHTRAYFWTQSFPGIMRTRIYIFLFGWLFPLKPTAFQNFVQIDQAVKRYVLQDFVVPMDKLAETVTLSDDITGIYPLWFCPCKIFKHPGFVRCRGENTNEAYFDIGIYGPVYSEKLKRLAGDSAEAVKKFEHFAIQHTGFQGMYADCYLNPENFNKMFDRSLYDKLRMEHNCLDAFPDVYEKISIHFKKI